MTSVEERVRSICLALPGVEEKLSHGSPAFFAGKQFVMLWHQGHHDHDFPHLWCAAPAGVQEELIASDSKRYFRPPYVGHRGWIGVRLEGLHEDGWTELAETIEEAFRAIAPKKAVAELDARE